MAGDAGRGVGVGEAARPDVPGDAVGDPVGAAPVVPAAGGAGIVDPVGPAGGGEPARGALGVVGVGVAPGDAAAGGVVGGVSAGAADSAGVGDGDGGVGVGVDATVSTGAAGVAARCDRNHITLRSTASTTNAPSAIAIRFGGVLAPAARPGTGCVFDAAAAAVGVHGSRADGFDDVDDVVPRDVAPGEVGVGGGIDSDGIGPGSGNVPGGVVATSSGGIDTPDSVSIGRPARPRRSASRN